MTERKLEGNKGGWKRARDEGLVSCHHSLLYNTCKFHVIKQTKS